MTILDNMNPTETAIENMFNVSLNEVFMDTVRIMNKNVVDDVAENKLLAVWINLFFSHGPDGMIHKIGHGMPEFNNKCIFNGEIWFGLTHEPNTFSSNIVRRGTGFYTGCGGHRMQDEVSPEIRHKMPKQGFYALGWDVAFYLQDFDKMDKTLTTVILKYGDFHLKTHEYSAMWINPNQDILESGGDDYCYFQSFESLQ